MPLIWRPLSVAALFIGAAAGLIHFGADAGSRRDADPGTPSVARGLLDKPYPLDEEREHRRHVYLQRFAVKDRAVQKLLAGQLTLPQAAARFRDLEQSLPVTWAPRVAATDPAYGERLCRTVIAMANRWMEEHVPAAAADVTACLEAELERHRGPDGTVRLPD
jgi:hypothetical protein